MSLTIYVDNIIIARANLNYEPKMKATFVVNLIRPT